jgi:serine/threonine protein kinase
VYTFLENNICVTILPCYDISESLFWTAPEHLRKWIVQRQKTGSSLGDIYSFGIIAKELVTRDSPYGCEISLTPDGIFDDYYFI